MLKQLSTLIVVSLLILPAFAGGPYSLFPIQDYDQNIDHWVDPASEGYNTSLLSPIQQKSRMHELYQHEYASDKNGLSPWSSHYITGYLNQASPGGIADIEHRFIAAYGNFPSSSNSINYNENQRPYPVSWINQVISNIDFSRLSPPLIYHKQNRAIATVNLMVRNLPSFDPHFDAPNTVGEGYPFDNLQVSSIWAGTPLYIIATSRDHAFDLVATSSFFGWVDSTGVAPVDSQFIHIWQQAAQKKLAAIIHNTTPILDEHHHFLFSAYIGSSFPVAGIQKQQLMLMIPIQNAWHQARFVLAPVSDQNASLMPLSATPHDFAQILTALQGIPYGWGNLYFYADCSSLLKSFYLPFGIWLPRHSSTQVNAGQITDLSALSPEKRLAYVSQHAQAFLTILSLGNHVFMFVGNVNNPKAPGGKMVLTFQTLWGLSPSDNSRRSIIGESVLLPLLLNYPEDPSLSSLLTASTFQISNL